MLLGNRGAPAPVGLVETVDRSGDEHQDDEGSDDHADHLETLHPGLAAPAHGLEHAPETMDEVKPDGHEPQQVQGQDPPPTEGRDQQAVRIVLKRADTEHLRQLHLGPEMAQVEAQEAKDHDTQDEHVLGRPGIGGRLAGHFVTLETTAGLHVPPGQPAAIADVDQNTERKDRDHDVDDGGGHEVAAQLEQAVSLAEQDVIIGRNTELARKGVDHGEEIDRPVKQEENDHKALRFHL